jgi:3-oxoacyl-[acyl-carrier protein] reductase
MRFNGKVVLVTGAGRGIGAATAKRFAREGARVVVHYNTSSDDAEHVLADIKSSGGDAITLRTDLSVASELPKLIAEIRSAMGSLDVLVNNAGIGGPKSLNEIDEESFDRYYHINVRAGLLLTRYASELLPSGSGSIVNISSQRVRQPGPILYSSTKGAVETQTISLARELAPKGIRVNAVAPGLIETEMMRQNIEILRPFIALTPMKRTGQPEEIAAAVAFLASDDASFITGEILVVSGGLR